RLPRLGPGGPPLDPRGDEQPFARDGGNAPQWPMQPRTADLRGVEARGHRAALWPAVIRGPAGRPCQASLGAEGAGSVACFLGSGRQPLGAECEKGHGGRIGDIEVAEIAGRRQREQDVAAFTGEPPQARALGAEAQGDALGWIEVCEALRGLAGESQNPKAGLLQVVQAARQVDLPEVGYQLESAA